MLYIVGTPIGNLADLSKRAIETLEKVDLIYAEDTRTALKLLNHLNIKKQVRSCYKDNELKVQEELLAILEGGKEVALISEAGMPTISDPGAIIIKSVLERHLPYTIIQGPTALIHAIIASTFSGGPFLFYGFLPRKESEKKEAFNAISMAVPVIFYESPERLESTLRSMLDYFEMPIAVIREATKLYEEHIFINCIEEIEAITLKGEFAIVAKRKRVEGGGESVDYNKILANLKSEGFDKKSAVKVLKSAGMKKKDAYNLVEEKFKE